MNDPVVSSIAKYQPAGKGTISWIILYQPAGKKSFFHFVCRYLTLAHAQDRMALQRYFVACCKGTDYLNFKRHKVDYIFCP